MILIDYELANALSDIVIMRLAECQDRLQVTMSAKDRVYWQSELHEATKAHGRLYQAAQLDVPATMHKRKCWDCGKIHWHADAIAPYVLCPECGSQDTRRIKETT